MPILKLPRLARGNLYPSGGGVTRLVECSRLNLIRPVRGIGNPPVAAIRRTYVSTLQRAINQKLYSRDTGVIAGRCCYRNISLPRNNRAVGRTIDGNGWRSVIACRKPNPVYRAAASRQVVKKPIG